MKSIALISSVEPDSIADELGWQADDIILSVNGESPQDVLDFRFMTAESELIVVIKRGSQVLEYMIEKYAEEPLGVEFDEPLFDGMHHCGSKCIFCFVEQLPRGLRKSLYVKDDDFRLSFLDGNFVTLANLKPRELSRIIEQRLSPIYVSVHCTDDSLRSKIIGRRAPSIMKQLQLLAEANITIHAQIVLCPNINNGKILLKTLDDLISLHPAVESVAVVPVGLTDHRDQLHPIVPVNPQKAQDIIQLVEEYQKICYKQHNTRLIWAADELYLIAGKKIPGNSIYEEYPQYENGVGIVRKFLNGIPASRKMLRSRPDLHLKATLLTAKSAGPLMQDWAESINTDTLRIDVKVVENNLLGKSITVAGLMCGKDIIEQLSAEKTQDAIFVPAVALSDGVFLDDTTIEELSNHLSGRIVVVEPSPQQLAKAIVKEADKA